MAENVVVKYEKTTDSIITLCFVILVYR